MQIIGSKIMIQNNTAVGTVDDIVFDDAGNLEYLIVANDIRECHYRKHPAHARGGVDTG